MKLSELTKQAPSKRNCSFGKWVDSLDDEDRQAVQDVFKDPNWSNAAITRTFREAGCPCARDSVTLHRSNGCKVCNRT